MAISDNPPAFPNDGRIQLGDDYQGMTLRDWFAGQALIALPNIGCGADLDITDTALALAAYQIADAMLLARKENSL